MRAEYMYGTGKGRTFNPAENFGKNTAWSHPGGNAYTVLHSEQMPEHIVSYMTNFSEPDEPVEVVYYNYKTRVQDLSIQGVVTFNNIRFHKAKTGFTFYGFGGIGGTYL